MALSHRLTLGQLDGGGVEIHPVALVQREVGLHFLEFAQIPVGVERFAQLGLASLQVLGGQLVDRLVEERPGTQRRFADGEVEQLGGFLDVGAAALGGVVVQAQQLGQGVMHHAAGEHLGRVVAGRALPVASGQPEHEAALVVAHPLVAAGGGVLGHNEQVVG